MTLKEHLRRKALGALPNFSAAPRLREALLVWERGDAQAEPLCAQVMEGVFRTLTCGGIPLDMDEPEKAWTSLGELICRHMTEEATAFRSLYLLWVGSYGPPMELLFTLEHLQSAGLPLIVDVCVLGQGAKASSLTSGPLRLLWRVDPTLTHPSDAVAMLLMMGTLLEESPAAELGYREFRVQSVLHNSVERDLALQVCGRLEAALNGGEWSWKDIFESRFSIPEVERRRILRRIPRPTDLPVTGDLSAMADRPSESAFLSGLLGRDGRSEAGRMDESIEDALTHLFGRMGAISAPEWLMDLALASLDRYCVECRIKLRLEERCHEIPVNVLLNQVPNYVEHFHELAYHELCAAKQKCQDSLHEQFHPPGRQLRQLLKGLDPYLECWNKCMDHGLTVAWWEMIRQLICDSRIWTVARDKSSQLQRDLDLLRPAAACLMPEVTARGMDWREVTAERALAGQYSQKGFQDADLVQLVEQAQSKADSAVHTRLPGQTVLFCDQDALRRLECLTDAHGRMLLVSDSDGHLTGCSVTKALRVVPVPSLGEYTLWEARFDACSVWEE